MRIARTFLLGFRRYKDHPEARVRQRYRRECADLPTAYAGALWASERWLRDKPALVAKLRVVRRGIEREFGLVARLAGPLIGRIVLFAMRREQARLRRGHRYEPPTFYETNLAAAVDAVRHHAPALSRWVVPEPTPRSA
jgi:hypothetical protein